MQDAWIICFVIILLVTLQVENILLLRKVKRLYSIHDIKVFNIILKELSLDTFRRFLSDKTEEECREMLAHLESSEMYEYCAVIRDHITDNFADTLKRLFNH